MSELRKSERDGRERRPLWAYVVLGVLVAVILLLIATGRVQLLSG